jgi:ribonuclease D
MDLHLDLISTPAAVKELAQRLSTQKQIAIDTEFIREKTYYPQLALIQVATDSEGWLIDAVALSREQMQPLLERFTDPQILKILHSAYGDQECLYFSYGITASPTLDTFEAASLLGYGESVSLRDLIHKTLNVRIPKFLTRTDWLKRPIDEEMKIYALADVQYLVSMGEKIIPQLKAMERLPWAQDLSAQWENPKVYAPAAATLAHRLAKSGKVSARNYPIFQDLVGWREERSQKLNIPRRRICDDETLMNIANARPKNADQLHKFRGIQGAEVQRQGKILLEIIHRDRSQSHYDFPAPPKIYKPSSQQARVIDFLSTYLKAVCQKLKIASRLIFTVKTLEMIVVENVLDPGEWVRLGFLSAQACQLVGEDLRQALQGKRALAIADGQIKILNL